jgi:23S rRNA (cytidine2498-2'-O)-methyltransferase
MESARSIEARRPSRERVAGLLAAGALVYHAAPDFADHLEAELGDEAVRLGDLYIARPPATPAFWWRNRWDAPRLLDAPSISAAGRALRAIQRTWTRAPGACFRRASLIAAKLPGFSGRPRPFPWLAPCSPAGAWTLLDERTLLASPVCASPFPGGVIEFEQDRNGPPSRAYLKLREALVRLRRFPAPGERCFDAGASPGGWTWTLAGLGARVTACDRSPLDERVARMPGVDFIRHDAFTLKPADIGPVDWLCCDAACYPGRLYEWVERWLDSGLAANFVCTIKMQGGPGRADFETPRRFAALPGASVVHLWHNKHELTFLLSRSGKDKDRLETSTRTGLTKGDTID